MAGNERSKEKRSEKRRSEQRERRVSRVQGLQFLVGGSGGNTPCKSKKIFEYWLRHSETSNAGYDGVCGYVRVCASHIPAPHLTPGMTVFAGI